ncbi:hypothetical protein [Comamonas sp. 26]|uniref:hypothetical protein n=1 Tax=Comamonas sp. 26 TaxID=2035201 RepID=UPI00130445C3|nr:hypothetical protein [Comamonas sp. 26]
MIVLVVSGSVESRETVVTPAVQAFSVLAQESGQAVAGLGLAAVLACLFGVDLLGIGLVGLLCFVDWFAESW